MSDHNHNITMKIQRGDLKEFEKIFREYYSLLCHYAFRFVKNSDQAEDIVQDLFFQLWENREKLEIHTSLRAYLYRATYYNSLQLIRKQGVKNQFEEYLKNNKKEYSLLTEAVEEQEVNAIIQQTLKSLPDRCCQIFKMSRFEGLKYHEIADKLSISVKTVEANMGRALKDFRKSLKDYVGAILF